MLTPATAIGKSPTFDSTENLPPMFSGNSRKRQPCSRASSKSWPSPLTPRRDHAFGVACAILIHESLAEHTERDARLQSFKILGDDIKDDRFTLDDSKRVAQGAEIVKRKDRLRKNELGRRRRSWF